LKTYNYVAIRYILKRTMHTAYRDPTIAASNQ